MQMASGCCSSVTAGSDQGVSSPLSSRFHFWLCRIGAHKDARASWHQLFKQSLLPWWPPFTLLYYFGSIWAHDATALSCYSAQCFTAEGFLSPSCFCGWNCCSASPTTTSSLLFSVSQGKLCAYVFEPSFCVLFYMHYLHLISVVKWQTIDYLINISLCLPLNPVPLHIAVYFYCFLSNGVFFTSGDISDPGSARGFSHAQSRSPDG